MSSKKVVNGETQLNTTQNSRKGGHLNNIIILGFSMLGC